MVQDDDALLFGMVAGDLYRVLHRLGAAVGEHCPFRGLARGDLAELHAQLHGHLIGGDHEAGMGEFIRLVLDGLDHLGVGMPHVHDGNASAEINVFIAFHVIDHRPLGGGDIHGLAAGKALCHDRASQFTE